jgi:hypothetical protein
MKKGHTIQWLKEKGQKDIQWSTKHNSEDARTPLITESELWCSTSGTRRVTPLITESHSSFSVISGVTRQVPLVEHHSSLSGISGVTRRVPLVEHHSSLSVISGVTRRVPLVEHHSCGTCHVTPLITESKLWCFTSATRRVVHRFYSDIVADITGWNKTHEEIIGRHDKQEVQ